MMNLEVIPLDKYKEFAIRLFGKFDKKIKEKAIEQVYQAFWWQYLLYAEGDARGLLIRLCHRLRLIVR